MLHRSHDQEVPVQWGLCQGDPPYGNERSVRILLECILVFMQFRQKSSQVIRLLPSANTPPRLGNLGSTTGRHCVCPQNLCLHIWKRFCFCYKSKVINSFRLPKVAKDCLSCLILLPDSPDNIGRSLSQCCLEHFYFQFTEMTVY